MKNIKISRVWFKLSVVDIVYPYRYVVGFDCDSKT